MNVRILPSTIDSDEAGQLVRLLASAGIERADDGPIDMVLFQGIDDVPHGYTASSPWAVLIGKDAVRCELPPERVEHWISVFRLTPLFLVADRHVWNYCAGWLVQSGRVPRGDEILLLHPHAISTLPQRVSGWSPEPPTFDLPRGLVSARPARFATAVTGERQIQAGDSLAVSLLVPEPNLVSVAFFARSHGATTCRVSVCIAGYSSTELILPPGGPTQWQNVPLPTSLQQQPGESFHLELAVLSGALVVATANFSAALFQPNEQNCYPALRFEPGRESAFQRFRFLTRRALTLLRQGDWRRFWFAFRRRVLRM